MKKSEQFLEELQNERKIDRDFYRSLVGRPNGLVNDIELRGSTKTEDNKDSFKFKNV